MPDPHASRPPVNGPAAAPSPRTARRELQPVEDEHGDLPLEQRALLVRLSQEVAALRTALDVSRHRIAALEAEASQDPVTGLYNQRAFQREIEKASAFRSRYQTASTAALLAIDGLSQLADRHGQAVANRLLQTLGSRIRASIRSCDRAARIDPYRFGMVFWNADATDCALRLQPIRLALGGLEQLAEGRGATLGLRVAAVPIECGDTAETILARIEPLLRG